MALGGRDPADRAGVGACGRWPMRCCSARTSRERFEALVCHLRGRASRGGRAGPHPGARSAGWPARGVSAASYDLLLAVAGDMPFINLVLVTHMIAQKPGFDVVIPETPHPRAPVSRWWSRCMPSTDGAVWRLWGCGWLRMNGRWWAFCPMCECGIVAPDEIRRL